MRTWMIGLVTAGVLVVSAGTAVGQTVLEAPKKARPALKREGGNFLGVRFTHVSGGVYVDQVTPGSPAWRAGLERGDVIRSIDDRPIGNHRGRAYSFHDALQRVDGVGLFEIRNWRTGRIEYRHIPVG